ncbi:hypothetical protein H4582DRAFT_2076625 [Lactarius indigo]|nr:hypothetical protein H4582DRAFT_2076625 [Lactarius indigo]
MDAPPPPPATALPNPSQNAPTHPPEHTAREPANRITTIQSARITATNSPAAAASENRKNKKRPLRLTYEEDDQEHRVVNDLVGPSLAPTITSVEIPAEAIQPMPSTPLAQIVHYPSSGPSYSISPYVLPPISGEDSPTPPATPTRQSRASPSNSLPQNTPDGDIPMIFAHLTPPESREHQEQNTPNGTTGAGKQFASVRGLVEADRVNPYVGGTNPRAAIDKFTPGPMPQVQDAHPTSIFEHLDLDLISDWENLQRGKLIAIPFDNEARAANMHEDIKARLMAAISEITKSQSVGVATPRASAEAIAAKRHPSAFLVFNLTAEQVDSLLMRMVWSSSTITF